MVKCEKCGFENSDQDLFCVNCGYKLEQRVQTNKKSKFPIIIIIVALLIGGGAGGYYYFSKVKKTKDYPALITKADEYLENEDYEQAIAQYLEAIKAEPKETKPYIQLADIYMIQEDYDQAFEILDQAKEAIGEDNTEINEKYDEVTQAYNEYERTEIYQAYYQELTDLEDTYGTYKIDTSFGKEFVGTMYANLVDMDHDGLDEMIVLVNSQDKYEFTLYLFAYDTTTHKIIEHSYITNNSNEISYLNNNFAGLLYFTLCRKDDIYYIISYSKESSLINTYYSTLDENKELTVSKTETIDMMDGSTTIDGSLSDQADDDVLDETMDILVNDDAATSFNDIEGNGFIDPRNDLANTKATLQQYQ